MTAATTTATLPMSDPRLEEGVAAIDVWQRKLIDRKYSRDAPPDRLKAQKHLAIAALTSASKTAAAVRTMAGEKVSSEVLQCMPTIDFCVTKHEFNNSNWNTDSRLHKALKAGGCARGHASEFGWWHLLTVSLLERGGVLPDPPKFLIENGKGQLPFKLESLQKSHSRMNDEEHRGIDTATKNFLRRGGGRYRGETHLLLDAPLAKGWWLVELAKSSESELPEGLTVRHAYEALLAGWRKWAALAARSSTRLAAPACIAAYTLAAAHRGEKDGKWPRGREARALAGSLMRKSQNLNVSLVSAKHLAALTLAD